MTAPVTNDASTLVSQKTLAAKLEELVEIGYWDTHGMIAFARAAAQLALDEAAKVAADTPVARWSEAHGYCLFGKSGSEIPDAIRAIKVREP